MKRKEYLRSKDERRPAAEPVLRPAPKPLSAKPKSPNQPGAMGRMQRTLGNQAAQRLISSADLAVMKPGHERGKAAERNAAAIRKGQKPAPATLRSSNRTVGKPAPVATSRPATIAPKSAVAGTKAAAGAGGNGGPTDGTNLNSTQSLPPSLRRLFEVKPEVDLGGARVYVEESSSPNFSLGGAPMTSTSSAVNHVVPEPIPSLPAARVGADTAARARGLRTDGQPLSPEARRYFEPRFGADLSAVRLHTGADADIAAKDLGARAFTLGRHIGFQQGRFDPHSESGRRLLAHEMTHVLQQSAAGGVHGSTLSPRSIDGGARGTLEQEARNVADSVLSRQPLPRSLHAAPAIVPLLDGDPATQDVLPDPITFQRVGDRFRISFVRGAENRFTFLIEYQGPYDTDPPESKTQRLSIEVPSPDRRYSAKEIKQITEKDIFVDLYGDGQVMAQVQDLAEPGWNFNLRVHRFQARKNIDPFINEKTVPIILPAPGQTPRGATAEQLRRELPASTKIKLDGDEFFIGARQFGDSDQMQFRIDLADKRAGAAWPPVDELVPLDRPPARVTLNILKNDGQAIEIDVDGDGKSDVHLVHTVETAPDATGKAQTRTHYLRSFDKDGVLRQEHKLMFTGKPVKIPQKEDEATHKPDLNKEWPATHPPGQGDVPGELPEPIQRSGGIVEMRIDGDGDGSKELLMRLKTMPATGGGGSLRVQLIQLSSKEMRTAEFNQNIALSPVVKSLADGYHALIISLPGQLELKVGPSDPSQVNYEITVGAQKISFTFPAEKTALRTLVHEEKTPVKAADIQSIDLALGPFHDPFRITLQKPTPTTAIFGLTALEPEGPVLGHGMTLNRGGDARTLKRLPGTPVDVELDLEGKGAAGIKMFDVVYREGPFRGQQPEPASIERDHFVTVTGPMSDGQPTWRYPITGGKFMRPATVGFGNVDEQAAGAAIAVEEIALQQLESTGAAKGAKEGDPAEILKRIEGVQQSLREQAMKEGLISETLYKAVVELDKEMIRLEPQINAWKADPKKVVDASLLSSASGHAGVMYRQLADATKGRESRRRVGDKWDHWYVYHNPYTDVTRDEGGYGPTVNGAGFRLQTEIDNKDWPNAKNDFVTLRHGLDKWVADRMREFKKDSDEAKRAAYLVEAGEKLRSLQGKTGLTRVYAVFLADPKYTSISGLYARTPLMLFAWHDDSEWFLENITVPSDSYHVRTDYKPGQSAPPEALFQELDRARFFPKGVLYYQMPNGPAAHLAMTEHKSWHEWVGYASMALAALGLALAPFGVGLPILATASAVCFAAAGVTGAVAAFGDLLEKARAGQLTPTTVVLDLAQIVANLASAGGAGAGRIVTVAKEADIAVARGIEGAQAWTGNWAKLAKFSDQVYVPLLGTGAAADLVSVAALTDDTITQLAKIDDAGGSPDDKRQAKTLLLGQLFFAGGMAVMSIRGAMPEIKAGKVNIVIDSLNGLPVARAAGVHVGGLPIRVPVGSAEAHATARWQSHALEDAARTGNKAAAALVNDKEFMKWYRAWMEQPNKLKFDPSGVAEPVMPKINGAEPPASVQKQIREFAKAPDVGLSLYERAWANVDDLRKAKDAIAKAGGGKLNLEPGTPNWEKNRSKIVEALGGGTKGEQAVSRYERFRQGPAATTKAAADLFTAERRQLAQLLPDTEVARIRKLFAGYEVYASGSVTQTTKPLKGNISDLDVFVVVPEGTPPDVRQAIEARAREVRLRPDPEFLRTHNITDPNHTIALDAKVVTPDELLGLSGVPARKAGGTPLNYTKLEGALPPSGVKPKRDRLKLFTDELASRPPAGSHDDAYRQLKDSLNKVEDANSGVPSNPSTWRTDGRIYPPLPDAKRPVSGHPDVSRYRSLGHNTFISDNGAIEIRTTPPEGSNEEGTVIFSKKGANGKDVWGK